jgi:ubiquinone/menaquinone biosynthesis C-methylase UbiE
MTTMFEHRRSIDSMSKFYNWFYKFYSSIGKTTSLIALDVIEDILPSLINGNGKTAIEYACGTGSLTKQISKYFKTVVAKDTSIGMISEAKKAVNEKNNIQFLLGNILNVDENNNEYDWAFVSFALHLFSPEDEEKILMQLVRVAREGVVIIDHKRKWSPFLAIAEWIEGSYYEKYISINFKDIADKLKIREYHESNRKDCFVMIIKK